MCFLSFSRKSNNIHTTQIAVSKILTTAFKSDLCGLDQEPINSLLELLFALMSYKFLISQQSRSTPRKSFENFVSMSVSFQQSSQKLPPLSFKALVPFALDAPRNRTTVSLIHEP
ncbi:hypothetical protein Csa_022330 [Cucumis sativus]|uniref:Uncharacterized protein n=1 Tax=Cucumis sativus TaxID=3659 RepID=A0A0A0LMB2_CUCSA|nr:hypothetical protein Csa_022330 [Cucumis sativus]